MTWTFEEKPSVFTDFLWDEVRELWNPDDFEYIEFPWQFELTNRWALDSEPS
jgi:hypothetical protein